ncbi:hypothetical protein [Vallitalea okinawensis]|uniref:hypothetical protein n=1 Tax=Vallitalea okinawensis TaxID=2078660 RepID=UPI001FA8612B|nr:hypothetical protein [Vallitalea okinawensis]
MRYSWDHMKLYHYYDLKTGPFKNLSDLSIIEAKKVQERLRQDNIGFASKRFDGYMDIRRDLEQKTRKLFIDKGGKPERHVPHYMTLGKCDWLLEWYRHPKSLTIDICSCDPRAISFTYGDLFPTMRYVDGKVYRKQVYTLSEIKKIVEEYGLPQEWNKDGKLAPERYVEVQVWSNRILRKAMNDNNIK